MRKTLEIEVKVGFFVAVGVLLIMLSILIVGSGGSGLFSDRNSYRAHFQSVDGLITGSKVVIGGLQVGNIEKVDFDFKARDILVEMNIQKKYADWIRSDAYAEIVTQGMLGDKFITIVPGSQETPPLPPGSELQTRAAKALTEYLSKGDQLIVKLNSITSSLDTILKSFTTGGRDDQFFNGLATASKNLAQATQRLNQELEDLQLRKAGKSLNSILDKINNGNGTIGALINDPSLYDDMKSLMGGANRNRVVRNLVRQTIKGGDASKATESPR